MTPSRLSPLLQRGAEMRAALWFVALFGVAVASALLVGGNQSTVTVFWSPYRVDLSLNLVLLVLVVLFVMLHLAWRAMSALFELPHQARRWRLQQKERAMHAALLDALSELWSEGLGIALLDAIDNDDPTALIGLPMIRTARLLRAAGIDLLGAMKP